MINVYGVGLPRTGGTSLAAALRELGYHGSNSCIVTKIKTTTEHIYGDDLTFKIDNDIPQFIMDSGFYGFLKSENLVSLDGNYNLTNKKFIMTTRSHSAWIKSLDKYKYIEGGMGIPNKAQYETLIRESIPSENLLTIDWSDGDSNWDKLTDFLDLPRVNGAPFPCKNC